MYFSGEQLYFEIVRKLNLKDIVRCSSIYQQWFPVLKSMKTVTFFGSDLVVFMGLRSFPVMEELCINTPLVHSGAVSLLLCFAASFYSLFI